MFFVKSAQVIENKGAILRTFCKKFEKTDEGPRNGTRWVGDCGGTGRAKWLEGARWGEFWGWRQEFMKEPGMEFRKCQ